VPRPHENVEVDWGYVGTQYLQTLRTPLLAGRDFTDQDNADAPHVVIVNKAFVDRYWPGQDGMGKRIQFGDKWSTVVGVTANGKYRRLVYDPTPLVLLPLQVDYRSQVILHVRVAGDPSAMGSAIEKTVGELNPDLPLFNQTTLRDNMQMGNVFERIVVVFAGSFGVLALILAIVGIYGVISYTTRQRTHEIGIRIALGAGKAAIFGQVLKQGLRLTLIGLTVGLAASLFLTRFLRNMLFGVGTTDVPTFATVVILLCVVALAACYLPARRAASVDPMQALRTE
jgi:predicted permease